MSGRCVANTVKHGIGYDFGGNRTQQTQLNGSLQRTGRQRKDAVAVIDGMRRAGRAADAGLPHLGQLCHFGLAQGKVCGDDANRCIVLGLSLIHI